MIFEYAGVCHRLAHPQNQSRDQHRKERVGQPGDRGCRRPDKKTDGDDPVHVVMIDQPAGGDLEGPHKSRKKMRTKSPIVWVRA